jgi:REP element-mobilizing transposase RayT
MFTVTMNSARTHASPSLPPGKIGLREFIEAKRKSTAPIVPDMARRGFHGWHERGYLPHFDAPHVAQVVTFMLADSFPITRRAEWEPILKEAIESERRRKLEEWLDRGIGACFLAEPHIARLVENKLLESNHKNYRLQAWVIMPNHVHLVVDVFETPLSQLIKRWKGSTAREANRFLNRNESFWQPDYFDTRIRDAVHLRKAIRYIEQNPTKAKLVPDTHGWQFGSARLRDEYNRLPWEQG